MSSKSMLGKGREGVRVVRVWRVKGVLRVRRGGWV
jgi:hypothetical protein